MNNFYDTICRLVALPCLAVFGLAGCDGKLSTQQHTPVAGHAEAVGAEPERGPHGGRLLVDGDFALELAIFETGVPPEFRVWVTRHGVPVAPQKVQLQATLTRLGGVKDEIVFTPHNDFLKGDTVIYEPHSFVVAIDARHGGETYRWQYDNLEGRTRIEPSVASALGIEAAKAGPATIRELITVYGRIVPIADQVRTLSARFDGVVQAMDVVVGDRVKKGQHLASIESDESLKSYAVIAPIDGVVTERIANPGEQTRGRSLLTIMDSSKVWAELAVFPADRARVKTGAPVRVRSVAGVRRSGLIERLYPVAERNQSVLARVVIDNVDGEFLPGTYVSGEIQVAEHPVPLAVKRTGLQAFRDFTVVYAQIDDQYEVRMLELGRQDLEWAEVLGGLDIGTRYVTTQSYVIKADIEKSGASHDH